MNEEKNKYVFKDIVSSIGKKKEREDKIAHILGTFISPFIGAYGLMLMIGAFWHQTGLLRPFGYWTTFLLYFIVMWVGSAFTSGIRGELIYIKKGWK